MYRGANNAGKTLQSNIANVADGPVHRAANIQRT
ncbi:hypothetical protein ABIC94_002008 [Variovorax paradoxus]